MTDPTTPGTDRKHYKIEMTVQTAIDPTNIGELLDYLIGGAMHIEFLTIDLIGTDDS